MSFLDSRFMKPSISTLQVLASLRPPTLRWWWFSGLVLPLHVFFACSGDPQLEPPKPPGNEDPWNVGGQGGAPPIYEEEPPDPPTDLFLQFRHIPVSGSSGGTDLEFLPNANQILMSLRGGALLHLELENGEATVLGHFPIEEEMVTNGACGLTNILLDPDFEDNRFLYLTYCVDDAVTRLVRYEFEPWQGLSNPAVIFETVLEEPDDFWHRFGSMGFEDDGVMWFLAGDHFHMEFAQDFSTPHGALHRIVPNRDPDGDGYTPADGNMKMGMGGAGSTLTPFPSLYAYGLRSPWRGTRDSLGRYWVADVGLVKFEEVNLVTEPGQNFGWPTHEGPCQEDCEGFVDPVAEYSRSMDEPFFQEDPLSIPEDLRAIWLGQIYENPAVDRYHGLMDGVVPYGDLFTGAVRALRADSEGNIVMDKAVGHLESVTQWKVAPDGYAYALDLGGQLYAVLLADEE